MPGESSLVETSATPDFIYRPQRNLPAVQPKSNLPAVFTFSDADIKKLPRWAKISAGLAVLAAVIGGAGYAWATGG